MAMERFLYYTFLGSLLLGTVGSVEIYPSVRMYAHDIVLLLYLIATYKSWKLPVISKQFFIFVGIGLLSLLFQINRLGLYELFISSLYIVRYVFYFFVASIHIKSSKALYMYGVLFAGIGLLQYLLYPDLRNLSYLGWDPHYKRLFSTLLDPNFAGILLALTALFGISKKYYWSAGFVCFAILLTFSRSSYLAFAVGMIFLLLKEKKVLYWILGVFAIVLLLFPKQDWEGQKLFRTTSILARLGNAQYGASLFTQKPLFGWGFNTLRYINNDSESHSSAGLDNSYIFVLATTGLVGFVAYVLFISKLWKSNTSKLFRASLVAIGIHSLFVNSQFYPWVLLWIWMLVREDTSPVS